MWSDERLIDLARRFVPAADEVWRLQTGTDPECRLFQAFADKAHYRGKGGTRQGIYICTPRGDLLASINSLSADEVLDTMHNGLDAWDRLAEADRKAAPDDAFRPSHRWESGYPENGLVLTAYKRDLEPGEGAFPERKRRWNRDNVWFTREEQRGWLHPQLKIGAEHRVARVITERLARFHVVDNARGQTLPYAPQEMRSANLVTQVVSRDGPSIRVRISGRFVMSSDGSWLLGESIWKPEKEYPHGIETELLGFATYDAESESFSEFSLIGLGEWSGRTQFNGRRNRHDTGLIGFVLTLAPRKGAAPRIPPTFLDVYNADWIVRPSPY